MLLLLCLTLEGPVLLRVPEQMLAFRLVGLVVLVAGQMVNQGAMEETLHLLELVAAVAVAVQRVDF